MPPESHPDHEGLQVVPAAGLEHSGFAPGLEVAPVGGLEYHALKDADSYPEVVPGAKDANSYPEVVPVEEKPAASPKPICGLRRRTFWIVLGVAIATVVVVVVLAVVLSSRHSGGTEDTTPIPIESSSAPTTASHTTASSSTSSSATFTAQTAYPTTKLALDCPALNATHATVTAGTTGETYEFALYCSANFALRRDAATMNASSVDACMQNCVDSVALGSTCLGVVWDSVMNLKLDPPYKNCFLKKSTAGLSFYEDPDHRSVSALRVDD